MNETIKNATALVTISNEDLSKVKVTKKKLDKIIIVDKQVVWNWPISKAGKEFLGI